MRLCDLRNRKVINVVDCKDLGNVIDLEFDECTGRIHKIIVQGNGKLINIFCQDNEILIRWDQIVRIGDDIVLVELPRSKK